MALRKKGKYHYGDSQEDLALALKKYAESNQYSINEVRDIKCDKCGWDTFKLFSDDDESGAMCRCVHCSEKKFIRDSEEYMNQDETDYHECMCGNANLSISVGLSFYEGTKDARWIYVGGYCATCGVVGNYIDWNER